MLMADGDTLGTACATTAETAGRRVVGRVVMDYEARCLRRRRLMTEGGAAFMVDLPRTVSLDAGAVTALLDAEMARGHDGDSLRPALAAFAKAHGVPI
mgnify:CR=1 FL=1